MTYQFTDQKYLIVEEELHLNLQEDLKGIEVEKRFFENGALQSECFYRNQQLHGPSRFYNEAYILLAETWFWNGQRQGIARFFYNSGAPYAVMRYKDDRKTGVQEYFYEDGKRKTIEKYVEGFLHGESVLYWSNGQMKRQCQFKMGQRCNLDRIWDEAGNVLHEENYAHP